MMRVVSNIPCSMKDYELGRSPSVPLAIIITIREMYVTVACNGRSIEIFICQIPVSVSLCNNLKIKSTIFHSLNPMHRMTQALLRLTSDGRFLAGI